MKSKFPTQRFSRLAILFLLLTAISSLSASQFEQFYKNANSGRVGLTIHNGQYGEYVSNGTLINPIHANDNTPLNMWFQWGLHNSYEKKDIHLYNILKNVTTDIELDIHPHNIIGGNNQKDWRVIHENGDTYSNCRNHLNSSLQTSNLSHCLDTIVKFNNDYPNHDLITLRLELKDDALKPAYTDYYHTSTSLDELLQQKLGSLLYTPADLKGSNTNLRTAAKAGWQTLGQLKGKVMVVLFDPLAPNDNQELRDYIDERGYNAKAFVAPRVHSRSSSDNVDSPRNFKDSSKNHVVLYCLYADNYEIHSHGANIMSLGRISMTYMVNFSNTPPVSEYRDFFIQRGRGDGYTNNRNPKWAYSGRLKDTDVDDLTLPPVVSLGTGTTSSSKPYGNYCLSIENNSLSNKADAHHSYCNGSSAQKFALIDTAIDYDTNGFPLSRGYLMQAIHTDSDGDANQKVLEIQGSENENYNDYGREVFQYSRLSVSSNNRPNDQYWHIENSYQGIRFRNANSIWCLVSTNTSAYMGSCHSNTTGSYFRPFTPTTSSSEPPNPIIDFCGHPSSDQVFCNL